MMLEQQTEEAPRRITGSTEWPQAEKEQVQICHLEDRLPVEDEEVECGGARLAEYGTQEAGRPVGGCCCLCR